MSMSWRWCTAPTCTDEPATRCSATLAQAVLLHTTGTLISDQKL
jgi:hypothetical protein